MQLSTICHCWDIGFWSFLYMNISTNGKWSSLGPYLQGILEKCTCTTFILTTNCIQLPFFNNNWVILFECQSGCPSWLKQVEFWFTFMNVYEWQSLNNIDWKKYLLRYDLHSQYWLWPHKIHKMISGTFLAKIIILYSSYQPYPLV